jgi:hypothetical protein
MPVDPGQSRIDAGPWYQIAVSTPDPAPAEKERGRSALWPRPLPQQVKVSLPD